MKNKKINKYKNLVKIMGLPGQIMDKEATKQMSKYAKKPENFLRDANEMMFWSIECSKQSGEKPYNLLAKHYFKKITDK